MKQINHVRVIRNSIISISVFALLHTFSQAQHNGRILLNLAGFPDSEGVIRTFSANGNIDLSVFHKRSTGEAMLLLFFGAVYFDLVWQNRGAERLVTIRFRWLSLGCGHTGQVLREFDDIAAEVGSKAAEFVRIVERRI